MDMGDDLEIDEPPPGRGRAGGSAVTAPSRPFLRSLSMPQLALLVSLGLALTYLTAAAGGLGLTWACWVAVLVLGRANEMREEILQMDEGEAKAKDVALAIRLGSTSFYKRVYGTIAKLAGPVALGLLLVYGARDGPVSTSVSKSSSAFLVALTFLVGAACSGLAGFIGLWVSVRTNVRVAAAAARLVRDGPNPREPHPVAVALMGGSVASTAVVGMVVLGVSLLFALVRFVFPALKEEETPGLLVGFGFGASFVALFAQLGGGIFTKAADVGADLVGKIEAGIPEDDPRNPAVIADLVGDNVGDCAARGADLFESIAGEIVASMILGGSLAKECGLDPHGFILFPLIVHAADLVVSVLGTAAAVRRTKGAGVELDPTAALRVGQRASMGAALMISIFTTRFLLSGGELAPRASGAFLVCFLLGAAAGFLSVRLAEYCTGSEHAPVHSIVEASRSGHATNVIAGLSVGLSSAAPAALLVGLAVLLAYAVGQHGSGLVAVGTKEAVGGLYGTAVATMGALSNAGFVLAMDVFGPISDNAGGIAEMAAAPEAVRQLVDKLDAVGNSTKAATKSFALATATLACFLLLRAFMDEIEHFSGDKSFIRRGVDVSRPDVWVAGLVGAAVVFAFAGMAVSAVGQAAGEVVTEVRRQFREISGILDGTGRPDHEACVDIVAAGALRLMIKPGLLATAAPILVGLGFKLLGRLTGDELLGARAVVGFLCFNSATGVLMGLFLSNAGGAMDNAKKTIEAAGGKNTPWHQASVTGDTVGDPLKDCAGPSLHVVIKLCSTVALVLAPVFV